jgi:hypothetical protein
VTGDILETEALIITRVDEMREEDAVVGLRTGDSERVNLNQ